MYTLENKVEIICNLVSSLSIIEKAEVEDNKDYLCEILMLQELINHFSSGRILPKDLIAIKCEEIRKILKNE